MLHSRHETEAVSLNVKNMADVWKLCHIFHFNLIDKMANMQWGIR